MSQTSTITAPRSRTLQLPSGQILNIESNDSIEVDEIPIIDVSGMYSDKLEDRQAVAEQIREASHRIGFFYVVNHGMDPKHAAGAFQAAKDFFALPTEKKMEVYTGLVPNEYVGYHPMEHYNRNRTKQKDLSEAFNWAYDAAEDPESTSTEPSISIWPSNLPDFKKDLFGYHTPLLQFARKMTRIFALALHLPEDAFDDYIKHPEAGMRICHYPAQSHSRDDQHGIGAHTDFECFTIVTQDQSGGLEVLSKSGRWIRARPVPDSFVINIADCFMRQTNDFFVSTVHRVINMSGHERYSLPFFFGFDRSKRLEAVETCVSEENPMKYPVMTAGEYYAFRANRAKAGKY